MESCSLSLLLNSLNGFKSEALNSCVAWKKNCQKKVKMTSGNGHVHLDRVCPKGSFSASSPKTVEKSSRRKKNAFEVPEMKLLNCFYV